MFDVVILAGGKGTRLRSVVDGVPKCLAPIAGRPFLLFLLDYLKPYNPNKVVLSLGYKSEFVIDWVREFASEYKFKIDWIVEQTPLGTGGGIKLVVMNKCSSDNVCILNGDTMFRIPLDKFYSFHKNSSGSISLALKPMKNFSRYGTVQVLEDNVVQAFIEKSPCSDGLINGGVYFIKKNHGIFDGTADKFSFEQDLLVPFSQRGLLRGFTFDNYFIDIGIPEDYEKAQFDFLNYQ